MEGGLLKGTSKEGTDRGMDGAREKGGRKRAEEGLSEEGREQGREGNFKGGILIRALARCMTAGNPGEAG